MKMKTLITAMITVSLFLSFCEKNPFKGDEELKTEKQVFVLNGNARTVSVIDPNSGDVTNDVFTTGDIPNKILFNSKFIIVINSGTNSITIANRNNFKEVENIILGENLNPWSGYVYYDSILFVTNYADNSFSVINLNSKQSITKVPCGRNPEGIYVSDNRIYITTVNFNLNDFSYGNGYLYVYSVDDYSLIDSVEVGINPQDIEIGKDNKLHILCTGDYSSTFGSITVVNPYTLKVDTVLNIGSSPGSFCVCDDGVAYLAAGGWEYSGDENGYIYSYNTYTYEIYHNDKNPILTHRGVMDIAVDSEGVIYAACFEEDYVDIIKNGTVSSYLVGDGPTSLVVIEEEK